MVDSVDAPLAVIFDIDGVLVDSTEGHFEAWSRLGSEIGREVPRPIFEETFGMHNRQIIPIWFGQGVPDEELTRLSDRKEEIYRNVATESIQILAGVPELIHRLSDAGCLLAVGSSAPRANVELILDMLGVSELFAALSTGDEVRYGKPHPEVFEKAVSKLSVPASSCVVVEDAPQGVEAAIAAGTKVVAVTSTRPAEELGSADLIVDSLAELGPDRLRALIEGRSPA